MKYTDRHQALGIDSEEFKILKLTQNEGMRSFDISKKTSIARATVLFKLNKLKDRGLINKNGSRPNVTWKMSRLSKELLYPNKHEQLNNTIAGMKDIEDYLMDFFISAKNKKVYFLEAIKHVKNSREKFSDNYLKFMKESSSKLNVIREGITPESALPELKKISSEKLDRDKMMSWAIAPDSLLDANDSFFILENTVLIIDLEKESLTEIKNKSLSEVLIRQIKILSRLGKKQGFSQFFKESI